MMTRKEIMQEFATVNKRIYDLNVRLDQIMRQLHSDSEDNIEDLNTAVAEMADVLYGGEE